MSYEATLFDKNKNRLGVIQIPRAVRFFMEGGRGYELHAQFKGLPILVYHELPASVWQEPAQLPLVSCILITRKERLWCLPDALRSWVEQTYPAKELIVVSEDPEVADALPKHPNIAFRDCKVGATTGHKRNLAIDWARGDIISHFDDDDWSHPERLAEQVKALQRYPIQVCGYHTLRFLHKSGMTREFVLREPQELHGNSLCYYRDHWVRIGKYPESAHWVEDAHLLRRTDPALIARLDGGETRMIARHTDYKYNPEWRVVEPIKMPRPDSVLIGVLSWNREDVIAETVTAAMEESEMLRKFGYDAWLAVLDNGSTDKSPKLLKEAQGDGSFLLINGSTNFGSARARNMLAVTLKKDYLMYVDCDITVVPGSSLALLHALQQRRTTAACVGYDWRNGVEQREDATMFFDRITRLTHSPGLALTQYGMFQSGLLEEYKFDENFGPGWGGEDNDWAMQVEACTGMQCWMSDEIKYLHRGAHGSLKSLKATGLDVKADARTRYEYLIRKWEGHAQFKDIVDFFRDKVKTGDLLPMEVA